MVQLLSFGDDGHTPADLVVQDYLRDALRVLDRQLLEDGFGHVVDFVAQGLLLVLATAQQGAVGYGDDPHLLAGQDHVPLYQVGMGLDLVDYGLDVDEGVQEQQSLD